MSRRTRHRTGLDQSSGRRRAAVLDEIENESRTQLPRRKWRPPNSSRPRRSRRRPGRSSQSTTRSRSTRRSSKITDDEYITEPIHRPVGKRSRVARRALGRDPGVAEYARTEVGRASRASPPATSRTPSRTMRTRSVEVRASFPTSRRSSRPRLGEDATAWEDYLAELEPYIGAAKVNSRIGPGWAEQRRRPRRTDHHSVIQRPAIRSGQMNFKLDVKYDV